MKAARIRTYWTRLSTGTKMLLILTVGLMPLGLLAIFASIDLARDNMKLRADRALSQLDNAQDRLFGMLVRVEGTMRVANVAINSAAPDPALCQRMIGTVARAPFVVGRYALFSVGRPICVSPGYAPPSSIPSERHRLHAAIAPRGDSLRITLFDDMGVPTALAEFDRESLAAALIPEDRRSHINLSLEDDGRQMVLANEFRPGPFTEQIDRTASVEGSGLSLVMRTGAIPISAGEVLIILLPVLMWLGAGIIGWAIVQRLLLRPLADITRSVADYRPGDPPVSIARSATPAREINLLGFAFRKMARTSARYEQNLEVSLGRQTRLVREIHHRVKNNLQVVASVLSLHARSAASPDAAAAYASIQRRVDALAVVHRNHHAEFEAERGIALRPLIAELTANLRASAPEEAEDMPISIAIAKAEADQDSAVAIAFLITEIAEFVMKCGGTRMEITLERSAPDKAIMSILSDGLYRDNACNEATRARFDRILDGFARQLRSKLDRDDEGGRYSIAFAVLQQGSADNG